MIFVSAMALESVVLWDDIVEKFEDNPTLRTSLGVTLQELTDVAQTMRQLMDRAHDRKRDLQRTLEAALQPVQDLHPRRLRSELDEMWEAADAAHAHLPTEMESMPLLNAPPLQAEADESAFGTTRTTKIRLALTIPWVRRSTDLLYSTRIYGSVSTDRQAYGPAGLRT